MSRHDPLSVYKTSAEKFEKSLKKAQEVIENLDREIKEDKDITLSLEALKGHRQVIEAADAEIRAEFAANKAFLKEKNLPKVIFERHVEAIADYEQNYKQLKGNLDSIIRLERERRQAEGEGNRNVEQDKRSALKKRLKTSRKHLQEKVKSTKIPPVDPQRLPNRPLKMKERKPRLQKEAQLTQFRPAHVSSKGDAGAARLISHANADLPTAADLAQTVEVQLTDEIRALAAEFNNDPVKIYESFRNILIFTPFFGSIQGSQMCFYTRECNAFDTASLLIALFRAAEIPARYVYGTIQLPIDQFMNWVGGFSDPQAAIAFVSTGGTPVTGVISGGEIVAVLLEHTWVEAYLPYGNYRGTALDESGKTWIPIDASFKQYDYAQQIALPSAITFDRAGYLSSFTDGSPVDFYSEQIQSYLNLNHPGATIDDVKRTRTILPENSGLLPSTLPYKVIAELAKYSELPSSYRYEVGLSIPNLSGDGVSYRGWLPEVLGRRLTVAYDPATAADSALVTQYGGYYNVPAYLMRVKPTVRLDGVVVAIGSEVAVGSEQRLNVSIFATGGVEIDRPSHTIKAGAYYAVGLAPKGPGKTLIDERFDRYLETNWDDYPDPYNDPLTGEQLYMAALTYFPNLAVQPPCTRFR